MAKKLSFLFFLSLLSFILLNNRPAPKPEILSSTNTPTQTLNPFSDLTIPYLKSRAYQSDLNALTVHSKNPNYTSYLTSYNSDGFKINALLTIPTGTPPKEDWPGIVFIHGYIPPKTYKTTEKYADYIDYLSKNGFSVLKIDLRGHGQSEGEPSGAYYSGDYIIDTLNAYSAMKKQPHINPQKVFLWGHSMGGNIVFRSFIAHKDIKKVVIWAGAVYSYEDFATYRIKDTSYQPPSQSLRTSIKRRQLFELHGDFDPKSDFWKQVPGANYLDDKTGQIQIHHAVNDPVVDIGYSRNLKKLLEKSQIDLELFEYQSGGHNIDGPSFTSAMRRTVEFYKRP